MELTPEQRRIIEAPATDLAVTAGAGSGKTFVLVERYMHLLRDSAIPRIAAVTFTDAAATEMRQRVRRAVMADDALVHHRRDLDNAVIGTVHSLALRLLREHPFDAGIDPSAAVLGDDEAELLRREASAGAIDAAAEALDGGVDALHAISEYHVGLLLPQMIANRDDVAAAFEAMGEEPGQWAGYARGLLEAAYAADRGRIRARASVLAGDLDRDLPGASPLLGERAGNLVTRLRDAGQHDWESLVAALGEAQRTNLQAGSNQRSPDREIKAAIKDLRTVGKEAGQLPAWDEADERVLAALVGLRALFLDACARYEAAKREQHALDFLDLELGAVALLRDHPRVAAEVRGGFGHLMVDEAQDINPAQAELIRLIAGPGGTNPRPHLFLVGDAKQSIYRFRGADVARFAQLRTLVTDNGGPTLPLSRSFRTHDHLVGAVNAIFAEVFADASAPYQTAMEPMTGRRAGAPGGGPHLAVMPIVRRGSDHEKRSFEADLGAAEIRGLLAEGREVWDSREGAPRPARAGDVAVLLRRFTNVHTFEQALEAHGLPYTTPSGTGFFSRQEVVDCALLLRWLAEPHDEIALLGVLRSPFFVLRDDTLLALREHNRRLFAALGDLPAGIEGAERARCEHAWRLLDELRGAAGSLPADALLERALDRSGVEASWAPLEGGEQARANIRKLVRIVRTLAGYALPDVVDYLERRRDDLDVREGPAVLDRPDAVQVMTVHAAKGLEFPIVWIPEAHLTSRGDWDVIRWRRDEGVSATLVQDEPGTSRPRPGFYSHLQRGDQDEDAAEYRRLFYVAATRAADYLYISGDAPGDRGWSGLQAALAVCEAGNLASVDVREPAPVDLDAVVGRAARRRARPVDEAAEEDYVAPLLERPPVIPVRASTPVTALREPSDAPAYAGRRGDGLGALRGSVVHRALDESRGDVALLDTTALAAMVREESERALEDATVRQLASEAATMLGAFARSPVAAALADPAAERWFELPFAWDWDGLPLHGAIDLVYRDTRGWHVIDFKTDRVDGATAMEVARRYHVQIGLYQRAVAAAVGEEPSAGLLFLRTGELIEPARADLDTAIAEARERVDAGALLDAEAVESVEEPV